MHGFFGDLGVGKFKKSPTLGLVVFRTHVEFQKHRNTVGTSDFDPSELENILSKMPFILKAQAPIFGGESSTTNLSPTNLDFPENRRGLSLTKSPPFNKGDQQARVGHLRFGL